MAVLMSGASERANFGIVSLWIALTKSIVALRQLYHAELQRHALQHGTPVTRSEVASLLTNTAASVFGFTERKEHKPYVTTRS